MKENIIKNKSFQFAIRIVNLYKYLISEKREFVLSKQLLRSGTSIGANIREAQNAESDKDFIHKFGIAQKEADETIYWLDLLSETHYLSKPAYESINEDATAILKIIRTIMLNKKNKSKE